MAEHHSGENFDPSDIIMETIPVKPKKSKYQVLKELIFLSFIIIFFIIFSVTALRKAKNVKKQNTEKKYFCTICGIDCSRKFNLERHMKTHQGELL